MKSTSTFAIFAVLASVESTYVFSNAFAKASAIANPVAHAANTNQGYMEGCKESNTAKECATGPGNNGEFTSTVAHNVNGPNH